MTAQGKKNHFDVKDKEHESDKVVTQGKPFLNQVGLDLNPRFVGHVFGLRRIDRLKER